MRTWVLHPEHTWNSSSVVTFTVIPALGRQKQVNTCSLLTSQPSHFGGSSRTCLIKSLFSPAAWYITKYTDYSVFLFMLPWPYIDYFGKCVCSPAFLCLHDTFSHIMCWWRTWEFWVQIPAVSLTSYTTPVILLTVHWPQVFLPRNEDDSGVCCEIPARWQA